MQSRSLPYLLLLPATLFLVAFFVWPFIQVAIEAFTNPAGAFTLANFKTMAGDWKFLPSLRNTFILALLIVPLQLMLALTMATLVTRMGARRDVALYIWTIPLGISDLAAGLVWLAIFERNGFLNSFLHGIGLMDQPVTWLGYQNIVTLFVVVILAEIWRSTAIVMVILVAGMGLIPKEYYEAAEVFGAGPWQRFRKVTLPLLKPSLQTALILRTILAFEVFGVVAALAGTNLPILMGQTFEWQFALQDRNVAAALAMVTLAISIGFTLFFLFALRTRDEARV